MCGDAVAVQRIFGGDDSVECGAILDQKTVELGKALKRRNAPT